MSRIYIIFFKKSRRSSSAGIIKSQLIWIHIVFIRGINNRNLKKVNAGTVCLLRQILCGTRAFFQGNKGQNLRETGNKDIYIGNRDDKIGIRYLMWEFNTPLYFRGTGIPQLLLEVFFLGSIQLRYMLPVSKIVIGFII